MSCTSSWLCLLLCFLTVPAAWGIVDRSITCESALSQTYFVFARSNLVCQGHFAACECMRRRPEQQYRLQVTLTSPDAATCTSASTDTGGTVFFFHGFGGKFVLSARNYMVYAQLLARAGYTVVEYDIEQGAGPLQVVPDTVEVEFVHQVYDSLRSGVGAPPNIDLDSVYLAGHSRGGKLAALHFAAGTLPNTRAAFLIDPVDCPCFAPESECYPSARQALKEAGRAVAAVGSTIRGCCNPNSGEPAACTIFGQPCMGFGPEDLVKAAGEGSKLDMVGAGHMQFAQLGGIELLVADDLCGYNSSVSNEQVGTVVGHLMLAWFAEKGRGGGDPEQL